MCCLLPGCHRQLSSEQRALRAGTSSPQRALENLQAARIKLSKQDMADLEAAVTANMPTSPLARPSLCVICILDCQLAGCLPASLPGLCPRRCPRPSRRAQVPSCSLQPA